MDRRFRRLSSQLLEQLADNEWHLQTPKGVGPRTVDECIRLDWVKTKRVRIELKGDVETFCMPLQITKQGRLVYLRRKSKETGRVPKELIDLDIKELRRILGSGVVRSLQTHGAVLRIWRRTTPHNYWVENRKGQTIWHSEDRCPRAQIRSFFDLVKHSEDQIHVPCPSIIGSDEGAPEESFYRLKKCYC